MVNWFKALNYVLYTVLIVCKNHSKMSNQDHPSRGRISNLPYVPCRKSVSETEVSLNFNTAQSAYKYLGGIHKLRRQDFVNF